MNPYNIVVRSNFSNRWKWRFKRKHVFFMPWDLDASLDPLTIKSGSGNVLVSLHDDKLTVYRHYHYDGATAAPDFKRVLLPAAVHDALLQLAEKYPGLVTREMADEAFKVEMQDQGFLLWPLYYFAVSSFPRRIYNRLTR